MKDFENRIKLVLDAIVPDRASEIANRLIWETIESEYS
jgi:hypothetical protein